MRKMGWKCLSVACRLYIGCLKKVKKLKYNQGEKFMKFPFLIYANMESLHEKIDRCHNNPK